ncbi:primase-helicase family protein [Chryseobacterium sp. NFX27]|uniref:primase-helicase family protein n=1 Tax=Chryseobacterium sp. NFX27 TaxID=2819618 RepID=UPI003CFAFF3C
MSDSLKTAAEKILRATNGGLDEILKIYPEADTRKNFRIRNDDRTASASMKFIEDRWRVTDWGGTVNAQDCFGIYALENNVAYYEAILEIGRELQNQTGIEIFEDSRTFYKYEFREYDLDDCPVELNEKKFHFETKDFNEYELQLLGPHVTAELCKEINLYSLVEYSYYNEEKGKVFRFIATDKFPILAFINTDETIGQWLKIYMPKGGKKYSDDGKDRRFRHVGGRPKGFIFGLDRIKKLYQKEFDNERKKLAKKKTEETGKEVLPGNVSASDVHFKLERICIATGGSDGLNLMSLGEFVIWFNSETEKVDRFLLKELHNMAYEVVNIPDTDQTGKREGGELALNNLSMKTLWLDKYFKFSGQKDFKDFVRYNQSKTKSQLTYEVKKMLSLSMPAQFWEVSVSEKGRSTYNFHHIFAFSFLRLNGFCRIDDLSRKDGYYFARVTGHVVEELKTTQFIKDFFRNFLLQKQDELGVREIPHALLNMLITSQKITDGHLANMHNRSLDFTDFSPTNQYFFLGDRIINVSADGITEEKSFKNYVLQSQLIDNLIKEETDHHITAKDIRDFKIETPYFKITKEGDNLYDIEILEENCDFLNYLIQVSRIHWEKDRDRYIENGKKEEDFYQESLFKITGKYLADDENREQKQHLINKIFAFGYAAHRFKDPTRPWVIFAADNAVIEDDVAEGGAGKSLFFEAMRFFMNRHDIDGKGDIENDKFLFEGVNQHTDFILFDDVRRNFNLESFFSVITSKLTVNEKFEAKVNLAYRNSPKFGVSTNYAIKDQRGSSTRRRLVMGFSDYYHASNDEREKRDPKDDFGNSLFLDWKSDQWFKFLNFVFHSCQFYLQQDAKIEAPDGNIKMRAYLTEMGLWFKEWADEYFPGVVGRLLIKDDVLEAAKEKNQKYLGNLTSNAFKKKTKIWCKVNGYEFHDRIMENLDMKNSNGDLILENGKVKKKTTEHIKIVKVDADLEALQSVFRFPTEGDNSSSENSYI